MESHETTRLERNCAEEIGSVNSDHISHQAFFAARLENLAYSGT